MGRYHFEDGEFERASSHAMTLASLVRTDDGKITIGVRDPNDDNHRSTQSDTRLKLAELDEQTRNIQGDTVKVLRWQTSTNPYRLLDGWLAIQPVFLMTNLTSGFLTACQADMRTGAITTRRTAQPLRGDVADLAVDVPNYAAAVIDRNSGDVWRLDIAGCSQHATTPCMRSLKTAGWLRT